MIRCVLRKRAEHFGDGLAVRVSWGADCHPEECGVHEKLVRRLDRGGDRDAAGGEEWQVSFLGGTRILACMGVKEGGSLSQTTPCSPGFSNESVVTIDLNLELSPNRGRMGAATNSEERVPMKTPMSMVRAKP